MSEADRSALEEISIRNLGVIENAVVPFTKGLNVLTGETGAGKTMVLTALALILGGKSDQDLIRRGSERLTASGIFRLSKKSEPEFKELLETHDPEIENNLSHQPEYQTQVSIASSTCSLATLLLTPSNKQISSANCSLRPCIISAIR